ncbi:MAG: 4Fe-4S binding protein [Deltaproteobacteria bacterium]|nr:4Fe-4S binding protein [Deltaproteobacteria bacterium]
MNNSAFRDTCTECKICVKVCPMRAPYVGE